MINCMIKTILLVLQFDMFLLLLSELLETTPIIVISTTSAILIVNARTLEVNSVVSLQGKSFC